MESHPENNPPRKPRLAADDTPPPPVESEPERVKYGFKRAEVSPVNTNELPRVDVYDLLQTNAEARATREREKPIKAPPMSRRARDYWFVAIPMNLIGGTVLYLTRHNPVVLLFLASGLVFTNIALGWLSWFVMDRD